MQKIVIACLALASVIGLAGAAKAQDPRSANGQYANFLAQVPDPDYKQGHGEFVNYGHWTGHSYNGYDNLPEGYWVYAFPNWYIWGVDKQSGPGPKPSGPVVRQTIHTHMWWSRVNPVTFDQEYMETDGDTYVYDDHEDYFGVVSSGDANMKKDGWEMYDFTVSN